MRAAQDYSGYISSDCVAFTTYSGGVLATITLHRIKREGRKGSRKVERHYWRAKSADGRLWYGRNSGPCMCIRMFAYRS